MPAVAANSAQRSACLRHSLASPGITSLLVGRRMSSPSPVGVLSAVGGPIVGVQSCSNVAMIYRRSQSAICCMAAHQRSRRGMTEFSTTATASLYQSIRDTTPLTATFAVVSRRFQGASGIDASVNPCDSMGQHNAKLMLSTLWCGQLTRLPGGVGTRGTKIGIAAPPARTAKPAPLILTH